MSLKTRIARLGVFGALAIATGCGDDPAGPSVEFEVIEEVEFAPSLGIDLSAMTRKDSGVYLEDLVVGDGEDLTYGRVAVVRYKGWLRTGTLFDQGHFSFFMGNNEVIPGFELGLLGIRVNGTRRIIIPPILGYGELGSGSIPPGSILIFEVELLELR